jgi:hypothetical protein
METTTSFEETRILSQLCLFRSESLSYMQNNDIRKYTGTEGFGTVLKGYKVESW